MVNNIKINLKNLMPYIKKILNWLYELDFVTEERDKWWTAVKTVMNFPVHKVIEISWLAEKLSACQ